MDLRTEVEKVLSDLREEEESAAEAQEQWREAGNPEEVAREGGKKNGVILARKMIERALKRSEAAQKT